MNSLEENYERVKSTPSDINEHIPTLKKYASECKHITEMGVRWVTSTYAFLMGKPDVLVSYDITPVEQWGIQRDAIKNMAKENNVNWDFKVEDTLLATIESTDLLFLDTLHTYSQVKTELQKHSNKVSKYIIFHDTTTFAEVGEGGGVMGIWPAIEEFLKEKPEWVIKERFTNNNGLTIVERKNDSPIIEDEKPKRKSRKKAENGVGNDWLQ